MAITPNSLNFQYKKGTALPANVQLDHTAKETLNVVSLAYVASEIWLSVTSLIDYSVTIGVKNIDNLSVGLHTAQVELFEKETEGGQTIETSIGVVTISLEITEQVFLTIDKEKIDFAYVLEEALPVAQSISIISENEWTIIANTPWIDFSATSGNNNGVVDISIIPNGLNIGTHIGSVNINDGVSSVNVFVTLIITGTDATNSFLYASPEILSFEYTVSGYLPTKKRIELNSSSSWNVAVSQSWLYFSTSNANEGVGYVDVGLQGIENFQPGEYTAQVTIVNENISKVITVFLAVYNFVEELLDENKLHFADDNNMIKVSSGRANTFLKIDLTAEFENENYAIKYDVPFFKGAAEKRIGLAAKKIIGNRPLVDFSTVTLKSAYNPVFLNLDIGEIEQYSGNSLQAVKLNSIPFLKGETPVDNWISDSKKTIYATKTGIVCFSFLSNIMAVNELKITGAVTQTFTFSNTPAFHFSVTLPLVNLNLNVGDEIFITVNDVVVKVIIKPLYNEQSFIFWENKWGFWDSFEFTGQFTNTSNIDRTVLEFRKDHKKTTEKILDVTSLNTYKIDTGFLYSDESILVLSEMLKATNMYLCYKSEFTKVNPTSKKIELYETNKDLKSYSLTFETTER